MPTPTEPGGSPRSPDGSAGDADYGRIGPDYARYRRPDARIEARIRSALGAARTLVNVGAGAGSYEPRDLEVTAIEPSAAMRAQRPSGLPRAIDAAAEHLPLPDDAVDAALAVFTVHQWGALEDGLAELRRVARGPVVVLTCDPGALDRFWLADYAPGMIMTESRRFPPLDRLAAGLGGDVRIEAVPIPLDCTDGFMEAYYGRPEALLDPGARRANSAWSFVPEDTAADIVAHLGADLASGAWDARWGALRATPEFDGSLRLLMAG